MKRYKSSITISFIHKEQQEQEQEEKEVMGEIEDE